VEGIWNPKLSPQSFPATIDFSPPRADFITVCPKQKTLKIKANTTLAFFQDPDTLRWNMNPTANSIAAKGEELFSQKK
jgi:hypothetical protein